MKLSAITSVERSYRHVYLSPHLDDVAVSCGGLIAEQGAAGETPLVVTLFTGDGGARPRRLGPALRPLADMALRRREDDSAMARLGADHLHLGFDDALFRLPIALGRYGLLLGAREIEPELSRRIATDILAICRRANARHLYAPLGVGQHVDHQLAFQAARQVGRNPDLATEVVFYEESPYVFVPGMLRYRGRLGGIDLGTDAPGTGPRQGANRGAGVEQWQQTLLSMPTLQLDRPLLRPLVLASTVALDFLIERVLPVPRNASGLGRLVPEVCDITDRWETKLEAMLLYESQVRSHLLDREVLEREFRGYSRRIGAAPGRLLERCWRTEARPTDEQHPENA